MKKIITTVLVIVLMFTMVTPAFAANISGWGSQIPIVEISGDGEPLYDGEGNQIFKTTDILSGLGGGEEGEGNNELVKSVANVLVPFVVEGVLFDEWDGYYENLYLELSELFKASHLNKDGTAPEGSGLSDERKAEVAARVATDFKKERGWYGDIDYKFFYDWRLDPWAVAEEFHNHIEKVKKTTGSKKVAIMAKCLGTNVVLAYVARYGTDSIYGLGFDGGTVNGMEPLSDAISGKFGVDGNAISRILTDCNFYNIMDISPFIIQTVDMVTKTGVLDRVVGFTEEMLYAKLVEGMTSALARATVMTWPSYWAAVTAEDYETAINYVFGDENDPKRTEYAGLIEKLDNYNDNVRQRIPKLLMQVKNSGANVAFIAKYGSQMIPTSESAKLVADQFVSVHRASFGATTSTVYDTLSDDYIAARNAAGKGKYISPDKQIDASTCLFPDYTWFIKGNKHSNWSWWENDLIYTVVTADRQLSIEDFDCSQFVVYRQDGNWADKMTTENCDTEQWLAEEKLDKPTDKYGKIFVAVSSFLTWLINLFKLIFNK